MFTRNGTGKRTESDATTETWQRYERGVSYHERNNLYAQTDKNHRYFAGDQWRGAYLGSISPVRFNFIKPTVLYKVSTVAQNTMSLHYEPNAFSMLATNAAKMWTDYSHVWMALYATFFVFFWWTWEMSGKNRQSYQSAK